MDPSKMLSEVSESCQLLDQSLQELTLIAQRNAFFSKLVLPQMKQSIRNQQTMLAALYNCQEAPKAVIDMCDTLICQSKASVKDLENDLNSMKQNIQASALNYVKANSTRKRFITSAINNTSSPKRTNQAIPFDILEDKTVCDFLETKKHEMKNDALIKEQHSELLEKLRVSQPPEVEKLSDISNCTSEVTFGYLCEEHAREILGVELHETERKGKGLFATRQFNSGDFIDHYRGAAYSRKKWDSFCRDNKHKMSDARRKTWDYAVAGNEVVVAPLYTFDSFAMYINHSDSPNARVIWAHSAYFQVEAIDTIEPGVEIVMNYGDDFHMLNKKNF